MAVFSSDLYSVGAAQAGLSEQPGDVFAYAGPSAPCGSVTFDDSQRQASDPVDCGIAEIDLGGNKQPGIKVRVGQSWALVDPDNGQSNFVMSLTGHAEGRDFDYLLTEKQMVPGHKYQVIHHETQGASLNPDLPMFTYQEYLCFARSTCVLTAFGWTPVEHLAVGDMVITRDNGVQPLRWIGSARTRITQTTAPITFAPDTFGNTRELTVSPDHKMLLRGDAVEQMLGKTEVLARARHIWAAGTGSRAVDGVVEYFHLLFDHHELVNADGAWSESFRPGKSSESTISHQHKMDIYRQFPHLREGFVEYGGPARKTLNAYEAMLVLTHEPSSDGKGVPRAA